MAALFSCGKRGEKGMANEKNLKKPSAKEAREKGAKGGKRSGEVRREKKLFQQAVLAALDAKGENGNTVLVDMIAAQVKKALNGDTRAFEVIRDTSGEKPADKVEAQVKNDNAELLKEFLDGKKK